MESFSEEQRANATKFVSFFLSQRAQANPGQLTASRIRFTAEELEGECLHVARRFLSAK